MNDLDNITAIRDGLKEMRLYFPEEKFVIFINPENGQGGYKLFGEEVIAHPAVERGKLYIIRKKELEDYLMEHGGDIFE